MTSKELAEEIETAVEQVIADGQAEQEDISISEEVITDQSEERSEEIIDSEEITDDDLVTLPEVSEETDKIDKTDDQDDESSASDELPVPELSDEIIGRAIQAGMTITDVLSFPSEAALNRVLAATERSQQIYEKQISKESAAVEEEDPFAALKLDPEKYEPEIIELFEKVTTVLRKQHEQLRGFQQTQEESARAVQMAATQEVEQWFDKQIEGLGKDFIDALGTGGYSSLDPGSLQFATREAIANQMSVLLAGYQAQGLMAPPREQVFDAAARLVLSDKFQEVNEKRLAKNLAKRAGQHIQRVGGSKAKSTKSIEEETAALIEEKFGR